MCVKAIEVRTEMTAEALLTLMALTTFHVMTPNERMGFAGCESENPLIGYKGDYTIVIDGSEVNVIHHQDPYGGQLFGLIDRDAT